MTIDYQRDADGYLPIEAYGAIGNGRTMALVGSDGSIDWWPCSRIDRPTVFARLLDTRRGGHWQIVPDEPHTTSRRYLHDTNVLVTTFATASGVVELIDFMPSFAFSTDLGVSKTLWDGMIHRVVHGLRGTVQLHMDLLPGFDYARDHATWELIDGRGAIARGREMSLRLQAKLPQPMHIDGERLRAAFEVSDTDELHLLASHHPGGTAIWIDIEDDAIQRLLHREIDGWRSWIGRCTYDGAYHDQMHRGALVLKLLDYLPSGAMAAAATTSLPERIGGVRNWDYRYAWIRDTTYALHALLSVGFRDEAEGFLQWVVDVTQARPSSLQIMYRVTGESDLTETELDHLEGYKGSRPVRIGNGAHDQRQLDRFGEVIDAAWLHRRFNGVVSEALWEFLCQMVEEVIQRWRSQDSGIWEVRSGPRRFTFSNVMCWVALDRAIKLAEHDERACDRAHWPVVRDEIRYEIMTLGVRDGIFTQSFEDEHLILDASALSFPIRNFIEVDHPVMRATIEAIERELTDDGLVSRYLVSDARENVDGLPGDEGRFVLCSCWLIDCLVGLGELERAEALLEQLLSRANDLGLYSEEISHSDGTFLGNFPQAFSHLGIMNAIVNLGRARGHRHDAPATGYADISGAMPAKRKR